eukprot:TRINITY_DN34529_c0_g1_i1.p4 TRINITY_DN34529_c0_g1~~TRINITY_DN34529_c0_g1_i1.p4  ORF type:complete len:126 (+),score=50.15 TRINITY_DN34529_c0_g1_i1:68-445(+)
MSKRPNDAEGSAPPEKARRVGSLKLKGKALPVAGKAAKKPSAKKATETAMVAPPAGASAVPAGGAVQHKTDAELKFELRRRQRVEKQAEELAKLSYRERIEQANQKLAKLTEHNDIPKVTYRTNK